MIDNGIRKIDELRKQQSSRTDQRERQQVFNRLHVILMQAPGQDRELTRTWLPTVESMSPEERQRAIVARFGQQVYDRALPVLKQLESAGM